MYVGIMLFMSCQQIDAEGRETGVAELTGQLFILRILRQRHVGEDDDPR